VQIQDQFGNLRSADTNSVTIGIHTGTGAAGATLSGGAATAAVAGVATFSALKINKVGTSYQLDATASGLTTAVSGTFDITQRAITVTAATNTKTYDGTTTAAATPTLTAGTIAAGDTAAYTETYDPRNQGTGKTLTPAATSRNAGNVDDT